MSGGDSRNVRQILIASTPLTVAWVTPIPRSIGSRGNPQLLTLPLPKLIQGIRLHSQRRLGVNWLLVAVRLSQQALASGENRSMGTRRQIQSILMHVVDLPKLPCSSLYVFTDVFTFSKLFGRIARCLVQFLNLNISFGKSLCTCPLNTLHCKAVTYDATV